MSGPGSLAVKQIFKGDRTLVALAGKIDEHSSFPPLKLDNVAVVMFDFRNVKAINSMGIQAWITFIKALPATLKVAFQHCPLRIVNQMNLFPGFMGGRDVKVLSFYAPYFCKGCDRSETIYVETKQVRGEGGKLAMPPQPCSRCKQPMELGAIEEKYLLFLKRKSA